MKKNKIAFAVIIAAEIVAIVLSLVVFSGLYPLWAVCLLTAELVAAEMLFVHAESFENQLEIILVPFFMSPIIAAFIKTKIYLLIVPIAAVAFFLIIEGIRRKFKRDEKTISRTDDKAEIYADRSVLLIVPHQDDDINLMGGMIEEYIRYKSDVRICFYTNGDFEVSAETRLNESLNVADFYGIPRDNIIFLGYGDRWNDGDGHIYTSPEGKVISSASGKTRTYALAEHSAYNDGAEYKRENIVADMKNIIEEFKPTDIFCIDYDCHTDHIACSLFFEEALLEILKSGDYHPNVYKGFAYETAFFSEKDFFKLNPLSTVNERRTDYMQKHVSFNWRDRVRFPVSAEAATRFIENSSVYKALALYKSQDATDYAESIINGDKVFWHRRTDSILYNAKISASSGNAEVLNDFKLFDTDRLRGFPMSVIKGLYVPNSADYSDRGIWIPTDDDGKKEIAIELDGKSDIKTVCLYDNPSRTDNIINVELVFDNGSVIETGPLNPDGSATVIDVNMKDVGLFKVRITDWDGEAPGLTEIEAFAADKKNSPEFIKLTDDRENFVYDCIVENGERTKLFLYAHNMPELSDGEYTISCDNEKCSADLNGEAIDVVCPAGESFTLRVTAKNGIADSAVVSNPKNKKLLKKAIAFDKYHYCILKPHAQKVYYKKMLLHFYDELMCKIKK